MERKCCFVTFGCKVNQYDTQAIREQLTNEGFTEIDEGEAEVYVVNTCTVTETAEREAASFVGKLRRDHPNAVIRVTGCATAKGEIFRKIPDIEVVRRRDGEQFALSISSFKDHTRAFVKVQDGCDLNCSFCIIPSVRGAGVSRSIESVVEETRRLIDNGYKEIVLTGVHLGGFGKDRGEPDALPRLAKRLLRIPSIGRVRLSSIEANEVSPGLIDLMAGDNRLCPHLHIPLQSGDNDILRAMRRRYNAAQYNKVIDLLKERIPDIALTTDVIVGFPGEEEGHFQRTLDLCRRTGFSRIHIFPYSPRAGTDAAKIKETISGVEKKRRLKRLEALSRELAHGYYLRFVGKDVQLLIENDGSGYTERYIPCALADRRAGKGELLNVRVLSADKKGVYANIAHEGG